ncbi:hypothetical protein D1953_14485 [Peribacillus asahii]|uniref:Uncharacterized protein n=1 Tax=Peribacillus asahii TaxID=228899 RepID=A0A398B397_9BACI|nr:hypothetical protein D1953_14485 [Peribacillus asahii]
MVQRFINNSSKLLSFEGSLFFYNESFHRFGAIFRFYKKTAWFFIPVKKIYSNREYDSFLVYPSAMALRLLNFL